MEAGAVAEGGEVTESDLCDLSARISRRISELEENAASAFYDLEAIRRAYEASLPAGANAVINRLDARCAEISAEIARAKAEKTIALEAELVCVDGELEELQSSGCTGDAHGP